MDYRDNPFQHGRSHQLNLVRQRELMHSLRGYYEKDWPILYLYVAVMALIAVLMVAILMIGIVV